MHVASRLLPHRMIHELLIRRIFSSFARMNGLIYFGTVDARSDEHVPVRGFSLGARTRDEHYMSGTVGDSDVTILRRTDEKPGRAKPATWTIASVKLKDTLPDVLLMSHRQPHDSYEAAFISMVRSEHVALEYRLDANFLIYAGRTTIDELRSQLKDETITAILSHPEYDYEIVDGSMNVYLHDAAPELPALTALLSTALACALGIDKDI